MLSSALCRHQHTYGAQTCRENNPTHKIHLCVCVMCMCDVVCCAVCVCHKCAGTLGSKKQALCVMNLEFQNAVSCLPCVLGTELSSPVRIGSALNPLGHLYNPTSIFLILNISDLISLNMYQEEPTRQQHIS